jgi:hypothetical protein
MSNNEQTIDREPIQINDSTVILISLFHRGCTVLENMCISEDCPAKMLQSINRHKKAAKQLIAQLEGHWSAAFMMALRDEIDNELKRHDEKYKTHFSNKKVICKTKI